MIRCVCFFFNDTATTEIYTLSLHDALPILRSIRPPATREPGVTTRDGPHGRAAKPSSPRPHGRRGPARSVHERLDRKSTRLNSSHANISYAVFCLKKKKLYRPDHPPVPLTV